MSIILLRGEPGPLRCGIPGASNKRGETRWVQAVPFLETYGAHRTTVSGIAKLVLPSRPLDLVGNVERCQLCWPHDLDLNTCDHLWC